MDEKATVGCFGIIAVWIIALALNILFWSAVIYGTVWTLNHFGVIG